MALTEYVMMPGEDYQAACDMLRSKTGKTDLIKSGDLEAEIEGLFAGEIVEKSVEADFSTGDMEVAAADREYMSKVTVVKPGTLVPGNIAYGVRIAGVEGNYMGNVSPDEDMFATYVGGASVLVNHNVTRVAPQTFYYNPRLTKCDFPNCSIIESSAFYDCPSLSSGIFSGCLRVGRSAFYCCSALTTIELPVCSAIDQSAFYSCSKLKEISLPQVKNIYNYAFYGCTSLNSVYAPYGNYIGSYAFSKCSNLQSYCANSGSGLGQIGLNAFASCSSLLEVNIANCGMVYGKAFQYCTNLSKVSLTGISSMSSSVFLGCSALRDVTLTKYNGMSSSMFVPSTTFYDAADGVHLNVYAKSVALSTNCFKGCLASAITLSGTGITLYPGIFSGCTNLTDVKTNYLTAWTSQFYGCSNLRRVVAGGKIGTDAFRGCLSLQMLKMNYCSYISSGAFMGCNKFSIFYIENFSSIQMYSDPMNATAINNSSYLGYFGSIYVPESLVSTFQADPGWASFSARITAVTDEIKALFDGELT